MPAPAPVGPDTRSWRPGWPLDLRATLRPLRRGTGDPAYREEPTGGGTAVWLTLRAPEGPATLRLAVVAGEVLAQAWGPGRRWALDTVPSTLGSDDDPSGFVPRHPVVTEMWRRNPGWRVPRTRRVLEALAPAILEQKVTGMEARRSWRELLRAFGEPAPGPAPDGMRVAPTPAQWRQVPSWSWHRAGVDSARSRALLAAAQVAGRLEQTVDLAHPEAERRLRTVPGIGVWTAAETRQRAHGDPDAVSVGDFHIPSLVGWALAGERVDDDGMLELLEPYAGHRYRAVRLITMSGVAPPKRGPRLAPRDYRAF
jgi:3-methyladenine DNA glycosylase/8-oxoguanine DNA glycosylase